jgi:RNA polymerase sigma factor (sigma-70 family)
MSTCHSNPTLGNRRGVGARRPRGGTTLKSSRYLRDVNAEPPSDSILVERALQGDQAAWSAIVERYGGLAYATARRTGLGRAECEDVVQSVFVALVRSLGSVRDGESLAAWISTSARRAAWRVGRTTRASPTGPLIEDSPAFTARRGGTDAADAVAAEERGAVIRAALDSIDDRCRHLLQALFLGAREPDYRAIGERFGIALNSVGPIRNRCLRRLLKALEDLGFDPSPGRPL